MKEEKDIFDQFKRRKKPSLPKGFFDSFFDNLMEEIALSSNILDQLKKSDKPKLPDDYFVDFLPEIEIDEQETLIGLTKTEKPIVPEGFFENFEANLTIQLKKEEPIDKVKKGRIIPLKYWAPIVSIAAIFALIFLTVDFSEEPVPPVVVDIIENSIDEAYYAYLGEDDIIDFIVENNVDLSDTDTITIQYEDYSEFSEEDIEDYYLEL